MNLTTWSAHCNFAVSQFVAGVPGMGMFLLPKRRLEDVGRASKLLETPQCLHKLPKQCAPTCTQGAAQWEEIKANRLIVTAAVLTGSCGRALQSLLAITLLSLVAMKFLLFLCPSESYYHVRVSKHAGIPINEPLYNRSLQSIVPHLREVQSDQQPLCVYSALQFPWICVCSAL